VAARICPHCKAEISVANVVAFTNGMDCPKCGMRLEVASGARTIATLSGLAAGAVAWRLASGTPGDLGAVLPTLYAFLAFGIVSPLVLMGAANLRNAPALPVPEPAHAGGAHGAAGEHDGGDHGPHH
jgi:DNA-directed RNA polymerase subunit RPC12/RpoP